MPGDPSPGKEGRSTMALASDIQRTIGPKGDADQQPKLKRELGLGMATALVARLGAHRRRRHAPCRRLRDPGSCLSQDRRPLRVRPTRVRRVHRVPDGLGLLDRRLGRQCRHRDGVRRVPDGVLSEPGDEPPGRRTGSDRGDLALDVRERPRGSPGRHRPGRDDRAEVRATSRRSRRPDLARATACWEASPPQWA